MQWSNPVPGLKLAFHSKWNYHFRIDEFKAAHIQETARLASALEKSFYASDYQIELLVDIDHTISFNLFTDSDEISEYVNRIFVGA